MYRYRDIHIHMYILTNIHKINMYKFTVQEPENTSTYYIYMCMDTQTYIYNTYIDIYKYLYVYVYKYIDIYICIHTYIYTFTYIKSRCRSWRTLPRTLMTMISLSPSKNCNVSFDMVHNVMVSSA